MEGSTEQVSANGAILRLNPNASLDFLTITEVCDFEGKARHAKPSSACRHRQQTFDAAL